MKTLERDDALEWTIRDSLRGYTCDKPMSRDGLRYYAKIPDRTMRRYISEWMPDVGSCSNPGGYYLIADQESCNRAVGEHMSRAVKEFQRAQRIRARFGDGNLLPWKVVKHEEFMMYNHTGEKPGFL